MCWLSVAITSPGYIYSLSICDVFSFAACKCTDVNSVVILFIKVSIYCTFLNDDILHSNLGTINTIYLWLSKLVSVIESILFIVYKPWLWMCLICYYNCCILSIIKSYFIIIVLVKIKGSGIACVMLCSIAKLFNNTVNILG